ncbi:MAG: DUF6924 domain-containing protein [Caulobacteraceae bacterium]
MGRKGWTVVIVSAVTLIGAGVSFGWNYLRSPPPPRLQLHVVSTLLVRTDYSDPDAWTAVRELIRRPTAEGFVANVDVIEDRSWAGLASGDVIRRLYPDRRGRALVILADAQTMRDPEHTLLCVDAGTQESLRVIPALLWSIENNLSLANLDWDDFTQNTDKDGVLRGFKDDVKK